MTFVTMPSVCRKCGVDIVRTDRKSGRLCRTCYNKLRAIYRRNPAILRRRAEKERMRRALGIYADKRRVHSIVHNQVAAGKMVRMPCEVCGDPKTHAHHDDYSRPLEVRWLCPFHHKQVHSQEASSTPRQRIERGAR